MKKNIFIAGNVYPENVGGAEIFDYYLMKALSKKNYVEGLVYKDVNDNEKYKKLNAFKPYGIIFPILIFIYILKNRNNIGVIFLRYSRSRWFNYWPYIMLKKLYNIDYIITIHGGGLTSWSFKWFYKKLFTNAKFVLGVSKRICDEYKKRTDVNVIYVPPLIPFKYSSKKVSDIIQDYNLSLTEKKLLYVGSLKRIKNIKFIVSSFHEYISRNENCKIQLLIAGTGTDYFDIKTYIQMNNLSDRVKLLGFIERNNIADLYKVADYYIIGSDFEGTPLSLLEAFYNKIPVIGADSPGINNLISDGINGFLFQKNDKVDFIKKFSLLVNNDNASIVEEAKKFYDKQFDYEKIIKIYNECAGI